MNQGNRKMSMNKNNYIFFYQNLYLLLRKGHVLKSNMTNGDWVKCIVEAKFMRPYLYLDLQPQEIGLSRKIWRSMN